MRDRRGLKEWGARRRWEWWLAVCWFFMPNGAPWRDEPGWDIDPKGRPREAWLWLPYKGGDFG